MLKLRDIMTTDLLTLSPDLPIREAAELLTERHISGAPVVEGDHPVGLLTATDLLEFVAGLGTDPSELDSPSQRTVLDDHTVEEAMVRGPLHSLPSSAAVTTAAKMMRDKSIHRVFVVDGGRLVGVVSALDVTRSLADGTATPKVFVFPRTSRT